jgi:hypothetical protein
MEHGQHNAIADFLRGMADDLYLRPAATPFG